MLQNENEANVGHGDDIADIEDHKELCQRIMDMEFVSEAAAYDFYNRFAAKRGFGIRKSRSKETKCAEKIRRKRRMVCFKEGRRNKKLLTMDNRTYRLRAETRCGCKAEMVVNLNRKRGIWYVSKFNDKHNHQFALPDEVPFLWSHRKIKDFQKAEILAMSAIVYYFLWQLGTKVKRCAKVSCGFDYFRIFGGPGKFWPKRRRRPSMARG